MKKLMLVGVLAALSVVGCKSKEEQAIEKMEELSSELEKTKDNCDKAAEVMEKFYKDNKELLKSLEGSDKQMSAEDKKKFEEKYGERMKKSMGTLLGVGLSCASNEKYQKAMEAAK
jgi:dsDNA-specific endonuclease/ATPase MutS2